MSHHPYRGFTGGQRRVHRIVRVAPFLTRPWGLLIDALMGLMVATAISSCAGVVDNLRGGAPAHPPRVDELRARVAADDVTPLIGPCDEIMHHPKGETQCSCMTRGDDMRVSTSGSYFRCGP